MAKHSAIQVKVHLVLFFTGIRIKACTDEGIICYIGKTSLIMKKWQWHWIVSQMSFIDNFNDYQPLNCVGKLKAVNKLLHGVTFEAYLAMEKFYQGFLRNRDTALLEKLGRLLYVEENGYSEDQVFTEGERLNCFMWFAWIKDEFAGYFPNFFRPAGAAGPKSGERDIISRMNMQIRALTGGDITKEAIIRKMDCWRALTELDAKALDARELKAKLKNK
jgi:hypothetical protein